MMPILACLTSLLLAGACCTGAGLLVNNTAAPARSGTAIVRPAVARPARAAVSLPAHVQPQ